MRRVATLLSIAWAASVAPAHARSVRPDERAVYAVVVDPKPTAAHRTERWGYGCVTVLPPDMLDTPARYGLLTALHVVHQAERITLVRLVRDGIPPSVSQNRQRAPREFTQDAVLEEGTVFTWPNADVAIVPLDIAPGDVLLENPPCELRTEVVPPAGNAVVHAVHDPPGRGAATITPTPPLLAGMVGWMTARDYASRVSDRRLEQQRARGSLHEDTQVLLYEGALLDGMSGAPVFASLGSSHVVAVHFAGENRKWSAHTYERLVRGWAVLLADLGPPKRAQIAGAWPDFQAPDFATSSEDRYAEHVRLVRWATYNRRLSLTVGGQMELEALTDVGSAQSYVAYVGVAGMVRYIFPNLESFMMGGSVTVGGRFGEVRTHLNGDLSAPIVTTGIGGISFKVALATQWQIASWLRAGLDLGLSFGWIHYAGRAFDVSDRFVNAVEPGVAVTVRFADHHALELKGLMIIGLTHFDLIDSDQRETSAAFGIGVAYHLWDMGPMRVPTVFE